MEIRSSWDSINESLDRSAGPNGSEKSRVKYTSERFKLDDWPLCVPPRDKRDATISENKPSVMSVSSVSSHRFVKLGIFMFVLSSYNVRN